MTRYGLPEPTRSRSSAAGAAAIATPLSSSIPPAYTATASALPTPPEYRPQDTERVVPAQTRARLSTPRIAFRRRKDFKMILDHENNCMRLDFRSPETRNEVLAQFQLHSISQDTINQRKRLGQYGCNITQNPHNQLNTSPFIRIGDFNSIYFPTYIDTRNHENRTAVDFGLETNKQAFDQLLGLRIDQNITIDRHLGTQGADSSYINSEGIQIYNTLSGEMNTAFFRGSFINPCFYEVNHNRNEEPRVTINTEGTYEEIVFDSQPPLEDDYIRQQKAALSQYELRPLSRENNALAHLSAIFTQDQLVAPRRTMESMSPPTSIAEPTAERYQTLYDLPSRDEDAPPPYSRC